MNFRRYYVPGSTVFITQVVEGRVPAFSDAALVALLRATLHTVKQLHPFTLAAYAFMPDHVHLLFSPAAGGNFSQIMHSLKPNFTKAYKQKVGLSGSLKFWQRRFWDHVIRDEMDFARHLDYVHYNPVKHGLVARPEDWPHTSFTVWKARGAYPEGWGQVRPDTATALGPGMEGE